MAVNPLAITAMMERLRRKAPAGAVDHADPD
jgi:hypothetical protein